MQAKRAVSIAVLAICCLVLACAPGANELAQAPEVAGFWRGLWHGFIAPFTFIVSLFTDRVSIYEVRNNGGWYNFGYLFGLSIIFGGGGHGSGRAVRHRDR